VHDYFTSVTAEIQCHRPAEPGTGTGDEYPASFKSRKLRIVHEPNVLFGGAGEQGPVVRRMPDRQFHREDRTRTPENEIMDPTLLDILVCPSTHVPVVLLDSDRLAALNGKIAEGSVHDLGGNPVSDSIVEALITEDGRTIYRVEDEIPIMLIEAGIDTGSLDW